MKMRMIGCRLKSVQSDTQNTMMTLTMLIVSLTFRIIKSQILRPVAVANVPYFQYHISKGCGAVRIHNGRLSHLNPVVLIRNPWIMTQTKVWEEVTTKRARKTQGQVLGITRIPRPGPIPFLPPHSTGRKNMRFGAGWPTAYKWWKLLRIKSSGSEGSSQASQN
jgi:hypothetical protein